MKIKVGDIFYSNYYGNGLATFYQVVKVYDSGYVQIRRIEEKEIKWISGYEKEVVPDIGNFSSEDRLLENDNKKGVRRLVDYKTFNEPSINITYSCFGQLWDGNPVISSYYYIWVK